MMKKCIKKNRIDYVENTIPMELIYREDVA